MVFELFSLQSGLGALGLLVLAYFFVQGAKFQKDPRTLVMVGAAVIALGWMTTGRIDVTFALLMFMLAYVLFFVFRSWKAEHYSYAERRLGEYGTSPKLIKAKKAAMGLLKGGWWSVKQPFRLGGWAWKKSRGVKTAQ